MLVCTLCAACVHLLSGVSAEVPGLVLVGKGSGLHRLDCWRISWESRQPRKPREQPRRKKKASKSEVLANFLRRGLRQIPLDGKAQIWHRNFGCFREYRLGDYTTRTYSCPALSKLSRVVGLHALRKMH